MKQEDLLKKLKNHSPLVINFGKGYFTEEDIKEKIYWNNEKKEYVGESSIVWKLNILLEIARGEVENTTFEVI